jgi:hypothetical protein
MQTSSQAVTSRYRVSIWHIAKKASIPFIIAKIEYIGIPVDNSYNGHLLSCYASKEQAREIVDFAHSLTKCATEIQEVK